MTNANTARYRPLISGLILVLAFFGMTFFAAPVFAQFGLEETAGEVEGIGTTPLPVLIGSIINVALQIVGLIFFVLMVYAGFVWMTARGDAKRVDTAKSTLIAAVTGLIIVALAYAITSFIVTRVQEAAEGETTVLAPFVSFAHAQGLGIDNLRDAGSASGQDTGLSLPVLIGNIIRTLTGLVGIVFVVYTIYAGFLWMTAGGESEKVDRAKNILRQGVIGIVIMLAAYSIATFAVSRIQGAVEGGAGPPPSQGI